KQSSVLLFEEARSLTHTCWIASSLMLLAMTGGVLQSAFRGSGQVRAAYASRGVTMPGRSPRRELRLFFVIAIASSLRSSQ
ncbi:MAG: hypothetical protein LBU47_04150, partial [Christensenellaceae bacterium]|nr:hypothetical protein [Christensenellaceae bacterium]